MSQTTLYLKLERDVEIMEDDVCLKDLGKLFCTDSSVVSRAKAIKVLRLKKDSERRQVVSVLKIIELIQKECPGVEIQSVGEMEVLIERVEVDRYKGPIQWIKVVFVSMICFFGAAFTIMAYHNDIGIMDVFTESYELITGMKTDGYTVLEVSYSIGLAAGIIIFFNHIGGRRITVDPTPIEVEMRSYEDEVNNALIETAGREGKTIDVD